MEKKKFKDTGFGKFVNQVGTKIPDVLAVVGSVASGDIGGAIKKVGDILSNDPSPEAKAALLDLEKFKAEWALELYKLDIADRDSARQREAAIKASGGANWMMDIAGIFGLLVFAYMVYTMIHIPLYPENRELFIHLLGVVEGIIIAIYSYYFGSSMGSRLKDNLNK